MVLLEYGGVFLAGGLSYGALELLYALRRGLEIIEIPIDE